MRRLIIVGAGGFGRELATWLSHIPESARDWRLHGFLDDQPEALGERGCSLSIIGPVTGYVPQPGECFAMGIGIPKVKLEVGRSIMDRGGEFVSVVHPTAVVGERVSLGQGAVICPYAVITCDVEIGELVTLNVHASIGHDVVAGEGCTLSSHTDVAGFARLGRGVFLGSHASILPGMRVSDFARVGAGSVVVKHVKQGTTVLGVPAKLI